MAGLWRMYVTLLCLFSLILLNMTDVSSLHGFA